MLHRLSRLHAELQPCTHTQFSAYVIPSSVPAHPWVPCLFVSYLVPRRHMLAVAVGIALCGRRPQQPAVLRAQPYSSKTKTPLTNAAECARFAVKVSEQRLQYFFFCLFFTFRTALRLHHSSPKHCCNRHLSGRKAERGAPLW